MIRFDDEISRRRFLQLGGGGALALAAPIRIRAGIGQESSPFLEGNFAPVDVEQATGDLEIVGSVPPELHGLYVRNGPNPAYPPTPYHWFDGDGMLHGLYLADGKARYVNRFVRTDGWKKEREAKRSLYGGFAKGPPFKNAANTSVVWHHKKLLALWEGGPAHSVDPAGLETLGLYTWEGKYKGPFTAHPKIDPETGELLFFGFTPMPPTVHFRIADSEGNITHACAVEMSRWSLMHDFAVTRNHVLFLDLPLLLSFQGMKYRPDEGARVGILPRRGKAAALKWFEIQPSYVFHTMNAYEEGDDVVLLGCRYPKGLDGAAYLHRWTFNLKTGAAAEKTLDDTPTEMPRGNDGMLGRRARYGYAGRAREEMFDAVIKYDLEKGASQTHVYGRDRSGGECVFVPRNGSRAEDDGWLMTFVLDSSSNRSEFVLIDARDPSAPPVAKVLLPCRVPYGFHGTWVPGVS